MDKHCRICHNTSCSNHGKNISFLGDGWKCNYIPVPTNADRIRVMNDEELNELFNKIYNAGAEDSVAYEWGQRTNSFECTMEWLQQPAEEDDHAERAERRRQKLWCWKLVLGDADNG